MLNTYPDKGALRVEKAKQALTMRKNHMFSEQKALIDGLKTHMERDGDFNPRQVVSAVKNALQAYSDCMEGLKTDGQGLPWAVKTSKHAQCQEAIFQAFDNDCDDGAGLLQNIVLHDRCTDWSWQDAGTEDFPVLGGAHGHRYWGTPNPTRVSTVLLYAYRALGLAYDWDRPSSLHYHYSLASHFQHTNVQDSTIRAPHAAGYALGDLEQTLGRQHRSYDRANGRPEQRTDAAHASAAVQQETVTPINAGLAGEPVESAAQARSQGTVTALPVKERVARQARAIGDQPVPAEQVLIGSTEHTDCDGSDGGLFPMNSSSNGVSFSPTRNRGVDIIHSGFCFGGAGELLTDYMSHPYPPHDCSSSVSQWFACPFRVSTVDQYVLSMYPSAVLGMRMLTYLPFGTAMVSQLDRWSFFDGKLQRAQQLDRALMPVSNQDVRPGDMYVMRITKPNTHWGGRFWGSAGHTAMVVQASTHQPGSVDTLEFSRAIEDNIEGFGLSVRSLCAEIQPNGNRVSHMLLRSR